MTNSQILHIGMINSYNLLLGKASFEEVMTSGVGYLAHIPDEIDASNLETMIHYFEELEMFEHCLDLKMLFLEHFHPDGTPRELDCLCDQPLIEKYTPHMRCARCNNRLRK